MANWSGAWHAGWGASDGGWNTGWRGAWGGYNEWDAVGSQERRGQKGRGGARWHSRGRGRGRGGESDDATAASALASSAPAAERHLTGHTSVATTMTDAAQAPEADDSAAAAGLLGHPPIAASSLCILFCPNPGPGRFTAIYDASPAVDGFGSVNAGNGRSLRVGGSGLNGQFEKDLASAGQPVADFQRVHQALMGMACKAPGTLVQSPAGSLHRGLIAAFAQVLDISGRGFVVVDVFTVEQRPLHTANIAMVYCVGPDRRQCKGGDEEFLLTLAGLGQGIVSTCQSYNRHAAAGSHLPRLQRVRVGLVSGGKYAGRVPKALVARSLLEGMMAASSSAAGTEGLAGDATPVEYELAYDEGVFEQAWRELLAQK